MTASVVLFGAAGRMGRAIQAVAGDEAGVHVLFRVDAGEEDPPVEPGLKGVVVVDFSSGSGHRRALAWARRARSAFVSGTTGLGPDEERELLAASVEIAVLHATNMSLGVAVMRDLVLRAGRALPGRFEPEIVEIHHRGKKDAPSGTAMTLARTIAEARGDAWGSGVRCGREGLVGARPAAEIGVMAVRGGDVVGEHTVYFLGDGERIEITHRATDRTIFARGAVRAAAWIAGRAPGRYTMDDVLGL